MGSLGNANASGTQTALADFEGSYDAITRGDTGSTAGTYTVRAGDTLQSIAYGIYGDSSLWYKIAQVNGLSAGSVLTEGQSINLPAGVVRYSHNAGTVKPYDPGATLGDVLPDALHPIPAPPAEGGKGCGVIGQIFLVVIAVAVTVVTAGAALAATTGGTLIGGISTVLSSGGLIGAVGLPGAVAIGAGSAAVGSIASQAVGVATGIQDKFSWNAVALAAIGGGVGAGLGNSFSGLEKITKVGATAARAITGSVISQGIGVATGLQDEFSWVGVAAAGVGAGVGAAVGGTAFAQGINNQFASELVVSGASALANAATRTALDGSSFELR